MTRIFDMDKTYRSLLELELVREVQAASHDIATAESQTAGKIRLVGVSNVTLEQLEVARSIRAAFCSVWNGRKNAARFPNVAMNSLPLAKGKLLQMSFF